MPTTKTKKTIPEVIAEQLKENISTGAIGPGARLPTEIELCSQYKTTRATVRNAYRALVDEGVVEKRGLLGYFVREIKHRSWQFSLNGEYAEPWRFDDDNLQTTTVRTNRSDKMIRRRELGHLFGLADDLIACRSSVHFDDGDPIAIVDTYAPYASVKDTDFMYDTASFDVRTLFDGGMTAFDDIFATRLPTPAERESLELPDATPVTEVLRSLMFTQEGQERCLVVVHAVFNALGAEFVENIHP